MKELGIRRIWIRTPNGETIKLTEEVEPIEGGTARIPLPLVEVDGKLVGLQVSWEPLPSPPHPAFFEPELPRPASDQ